jgi:hypothetical protein
VDGVGDDPGREPVNGSPVPGSWIAIAQSAFEIRSPTEISMSYSRGCGRGGSRYAAGSGRRSSRPSRRTPTTRFRLAGGDEARDLLDLCRVRDRGAAELRGEQVTTACLGIGGDRGTGS